MTPRATSLSSPATIHVVDDDTSFRNAVSRLLRAAGHEVRCYPSAVEFLAAAPGATPGCVLLDLQMPGPSGLDLQESLAKAADPLPIIFLTGHGDIPTSVYAMRAGAGDFLTKPVKKEVLFPAIERALARDSQEREQRARRGVGVPVAPPSAGVMLTEHERAPEIGDHRPPVTGEQHVGR